MSRVHRSVKWLAARAGWASAGSCAVALLRRACGAFPDRTAHLEKLEERTLLSGVGFIEGPNSFFPQAPNAIADFDGDGFNDLAFTSAESVDVLRVFANNRPSAVRFQPAAAVSTGFAINQPFNAGLLVGDYDGDNDLDLIAPGNPGGALFIRNNGSFNFNPEFIISGAVAYRDLTQFDFDGDNDLDLAYINSTGRLVVLRNIGGTNVFESVATAPGIQLSSDLRFLSGRSTGNADNDSRPDIFLYSQNDQRITVVRNTANGLIVGQQLSSVETRPWGGDFNADGFLDLVWTRGNDTSAELMGSSGSAQGLPSGQRLRDGRGTGYTAIAGTGDVDNDGDIDLVVLRQGSPNRNWIALLNTSGHFDGLEINVASLGTADPTPLIVGDLNRDNRADAVRFAPAIGVVPSQVLTSLSVSGPVIGGLNAPTEPVIPGQPLTLSVAGLVRDSNRTINSVRFFLDSNTNGRLDQNDKFIGSATPTGDAATLTWVVADGLPAGNIEVYAIATDNAATSAVSERAIPLWTRLYYPEGFRALGNVNEFIPFVNPNSVPVQFRVVVRYEFGERDATYATGTIPANTRGGVATSVREWTLEQSTIRPDVAYAFEVQSSLPIGAQLSRYDTFGRPSSAQGTGESFTNRAARAFAFGEATARPGFLDFIVIYNPFPDDITATFRITNPQTGAVANVVRQLGGYRRNGLAMIDALRDGLIDGFSNYVVTVSATGPIIAAQSRYVPGAGRAFTSLGQYLEFDGTAFTTTNFITTGVDIRNAVTNQTTLFNPGASSVTVQINGTYEGSTQTRTRSVVLAPGQRQVINLSDNAPSGAMAGSFRITAPSLVYVTTETLDTTRGDALETFTASFASRRWGFADGFIFKPQAGVFSFENASIFNPNATAANVTLRFLWEDSATTSFSLTINPNSGRVLRLDQLSALLNGITTNRYWFSTVIESDVPIIAGFTHWDLYQPGGWTTLGTPLDSVVPIPS